MLHKISYSDFDQLFRMNETMLIHLHDASCNGSGIVKKHLYRLDRDLKKELIILQLELDSNFFVADYLGKGLRPGLYLIKDGICRKDFSMRPISFRLFKFLVEEYIREEEIEYAAA